MQRQRRESRRNMNDEDYEREQRFESEGKPARGASSGRATTRLSPPQKKTARRGPSSRASTSSRSGTSARRIASSRTTRSTKSGKSGKSTSRGSRASR